ncbi:PREDICTED: uncharacterized protein PB18E9.04c-like [Camelina sativa]|uniref:Uncharacterized protein PB18E9.04c-like n=1 Tax=Camelina sativa TaxID=90675 RepID=A0ABM0VXQ2_CAMSA|nr:PREDICTED: uncharacterized protein PB18E9.04c-like [Camelina sativa]
MANSWFLNSLVSLLNFPAGSFNRPPSFPSDLHNLSSHSDFPSLASEVTSPSTLPLQLLPEVVSTTQLLTFYLVSSSKLSLNPRSGSLLSGSENATVATKNLNSSSTTVLSPSSQSFYGILGTTPSQLPDSSNPPIQNAKPSYVVISKASPPLPSHYPPTSLNVPLPPKTATDPISYASKEYVDCNVACTPDQEDIRTSFLLSTISTDDWTINLTSISTAHVKVEVDSTKPLLPFLKVLRADGSLFTVKVEYPWVPPICSHCKEVGHILRNCLLAPPPATSSPPAAPTNSSGPQVVPHTCYLCKEVGHFMRNCPTSVNRCTPVTSKAKRNHVPNSNHVKHTAQTAQTDHVVQTVPKTHVATDLPFESTPLSHIKSTNVGIKIDYVAPVSTKPAPVSPTETSQLEEPTTEPTLVSPTETSQLEEHMVIDVIPYKETNQSVITFESPITADSPMDVQVDCVLALKAEFVSRPIVVSDNSLALPLTNKYDGQKITPTSFNPFIPSEPPYTNTNPPKSFSPTKNSYSVITSQPLFIPSPFNSKVSSSTLGQIPLFTQKEAQSKPQ